MKTDTLRGTAVTARVGLALGVAVAICFVTGLISHFIQHPQPWFFWPTRPVWLYRVTQGLHVISGIAAIPLIGALNLSVSFYLAFRLALQAHNVSNVDRARPA